MTLQAEEILNVLDRCCDSFTFPMLDNGYVYLAATRLSLFRSTIDWALAIEVFGFSPRSGLPDTQIYTFGNRLHNRKKPEDYVTQEAYENYLKHNSNNESQFIFPIAEGPWQDPEDPEVLAKDMVELSLRGQLVTLPARDVYEKNGIALAKADTIFVYEACRLLASTRRNMVLATISERRINVPPELTELLVLDEWVHPNVVDDSCRPSSSETFQQLASVLVTGDVTIYRPAAPPNTHWSHWPDGGSL